MSTVTEYWGTAREFRTGDQIFHYALLVYTPHHFPQNHVETLFNLGIVYQSLIVFDISLPYFRSAIETVKF
jgi:hypothetical protein